MLPFLNVTVEPVAIFPLTVFSITTETFDEQVRYVLLNWSDVIFAGTREMVFELLSVLTPLTDFTEYVASGSFGGYPFSPLSLMYFG